MANNLRKFDNEESYNAATLVRPAVSWIVDTNTVKFDPIEPTPPSFDGKYKFTLTDDSVVSAECDSSSAITFDEISAYKATMKEAVVGDCVTSIGQRAFYDCRRLTSVTIPSGVTSIGQCAFQSCSGLTSVTIGSGVTSISDYTFQACSSLTSIDIPCGVTSIGQCAFYDCSGLTSVTIPSGVTSIKYAAFMNCSSFTSITVEATTPPTLEVKNAFDNTNNCPIYVPSASVDAYKAANRWSSYASRIQAIP